MSKVILYVAASVDGFIARKDGDVEWLNDFITEGEDYGYNEFYQSIDALIMGCNTYEIICGFGDWAYTGKPSFIMSKGEFKAISGDINFTQEDPVSLVKRLNNDGYKNIWLVGGGLLASSMIELELVDEMIISIIPLELKEGIPLLICSEEKLNLFELVKTKSYDSDLVQQFYIKRQ